MIKLASPDIDETDIQYAVDVIRSGNLVEGESVKKFEEKLVEFTQLGYASVVSSATAGLHLALRALDIGIDDYVIVPTFTFAATANVVENIGANVIFCDVDIDSYVFNPREIEKIIFSNSDKNIRAIIVVHEFGYPANMQEISKISKKYNIQLIEDAACALGTIADNHHVGYYSDMAVFSFHPRKAITSGEGGAVLSTNKMLIDKIKILKNHGIVRTENKIDFVEAGLNYRLTDFQAALMLGQIDRFKNELKKRKKLVDLYCKRLERVKNIKLPKKHNGHSWQSFMILLPDYIDRNLVIQKLLEVGIQTSLGAQSLPMLTYYKNKYHTRENEYTNSKILFEKGIVLPLYGKLNHVDIDYICDEIEKLS